MKRRDFLRNTGWFVVGASLVGLPACGDNKTPGPDGATPEPAGTYKFPQGVASGDPRAASVVLWTRAVTSAAGAGDVTVNLQVSPEPNFAMLVVDQWITASASSDHTLRVLVEGLSAGTTYHYRFIAGSDTAVGRTRTAPAATADVQVNLAWVSCQDYSAGHYGAYRQMIVDDDARPEVDRIQAVIHLGDMIYETRADAFQTALNDNFEPVALKNRDGSDRAVATLPSGSTATFATTVDDYRHLYKTFLSDPDLQAARARWPFIQIWDDHEFTDDCWQSQANYTDTMTGDEGSQARRVAASQAWFEFTPAHLTGATGVAGVTSAAKDFAKATVSNAPFTAPNADNFVPEPNNVAAVGAITIYRSLRFGKHVELVMTDERSYRSDHAVPEDTVATEGAKQPGLFFASRSVLPLPLVNAFDQGATAPGGAKNPFMLGPIPIPNPRVSSPPGTMLGKQQKAWWKATMKGSDATWKLWGNEVTLMRLKIQKLGSTDIDDRVLAADSWDGYPTERNELMSYLRTEGIKNVVVLSGDVHAAFAGIIMDNFDATDPAPVACELVGPGVTSNSLFSGFEVATRNGNPLRGIIAVDATAKGGPKFTENLNMLLLNGFDSAGAFARGIATPGVDFPTALGAALDARKPDVNPHLKYADTNAQGYAYAKINGTQVAASIVTINRPIANPSDAGPGIKRTASFTIPKDNPAGMTGPEITGTKPFPVT